MVVGRRASDMAIEASERLSLGGGGGVSGAGAESQLGTHDDLAASESVEDGGEAA